MTRYFSDGKETQRVYGCWPMPNEEFVKKFPGVKGIRYDSFSRMVGSSTALIGGAVLPITRQIRYRTAPSLHDCTGKCKGGRPGGVCECRCGGKNHGVNRI